MQAVKLQTEANELLDNDKRLNEKFSNGLISHFQNRHNLKMKRVQGEALRADEDAFRDAIYKSKSKMVGLNSCDMWNADKFGLFTGNHQGRYCLIPLHLVKRRITRAFQYMRAVIPMNLSVCS